MTRENTNNLGQYFVLDIRHTIYGSIIGMSLCGFSHNKKLFDYYFFHFRFPLRAMVVKIQHVVKVDKTQFIINK
jgi:hypothetical protein